VRDLVLDATVVLPWFDKQRAASSDAERILRRDFEAGLLSVAVPPLLYLEVVNVAGRQWEWGETALVDLANELQAVGFEVAEPALSSVANWVARGLTADDATYVALAELRGIPLITSDREVLTIGRGIAQSPAAAVEG
jgi:predicted nucleic acid-binding protein